MKHRQIAGNDVAAKDVADFSRSEHADSIADVLQFTPDTNRSRRIGCRLIKIHRWQLPSTCHPKSSSVHATIFQDFLKSSKYAGREIAPSP
uniref:Uncharacterized protein n=1 Tax=Ditylenchus dipsaci TaxID=166011 RepID=A0A915D2S7_9BILA